MAMKVHYKSHLKLISGGQTGVDRAALDFALKEGFQHGGWCPKGRIAEDGPIPEKYQLQQTETARYPPRTRRNIEDADATLIIATALPLSGGTLLTKQIAVKKFKPVLVVIETDQLEISARKLAQFIDEERISTLNVAGPRRSNAPELAEFTKRLLRQALRP